MYDGKSGEGDRKARGGWVLVVVLVLQYVGWSKWRKIGEDSDAKEELLLLLLSWVCEFVVGCWSLRRFSTWGLE